jgi:hypothetical protein
MKHDSTDPENDELLSRLVRAGAAEKPSSRSMSRTLSALGLGATTLGIAASAGAAGAGSPVGKLTLAIIGKWAGLGIASGVVAASVAYGTARLASPPPRPSSLQVQAPVSPRSAPTSRAVVSPAPAAPREESAPAPVARPPSPKSAAPDDAAGVPLAAELLLVDRGRAFLQRGESLAALSALERYERDFAEARLLPEVLYLRMEALRQLGRDAQATAVAQQLAKSFPRSPHAAKARAVVAGTQ